MLKKERLERLISAIDGLVKGENVMTAFDNSEFEKYKAEVKEKWGGTDAYREYEEKTGKHSADKWNDLTAGMNGILEEFAVYMKSGGNPDAEEALNLVKSLQKFITENYYNCTNEILAGLGKMYVADDRFRKNINKHADGTAEFISQAIEAYCK